MGHYARIAPDDARDMIDERDVTIVDIRDAQSFATKRITDAQHLSNETAAAFVTDTDKSLPLIVCCYHGNSSQQTGQYLAEQGFNEVYSLDGGFELWNVRFPDDVEPDN